MPGHKKKMARKMGEKGTLTDKDVKAARIKSISDLRATKRARDAGEKGALTDADIEKYTRRK